MKINDESWWGKCASFPHRRIHDGILCVGHWLSIEGLRTSTCCYYLFMGEYQQPAQQPLIQGWSSSPSVVHWRQTKRTDLPGCWSPTLFHLTLKNHFTITNLRKKIYFSYLYYFTSPNSWLVFTCLFRNLFFKFSFNF